MAITTLESEKQAYLAAESERWDKAARKVAGLLQSSDPQVRELTERLLLLDGQGLFHAFGGVAYGFGIKIDSYYNEVGSSSLVSYFEFIERFINYEILDDGDPGIGYFRFSMCDETDDDDLSTYKTCTADTPGAQPYFCRHTEALYKAGLGDGRGVTLEQAINVLKFYENERLERIKFYELELASGDAMFTAEEIESLKRDDAGEKMRRVLKDLIAQYGSTEAETTQIRNNERK